MRRPYLPKRWQVLPGDIQAEAKLQIELGVHPIMARLLVQRGLTTPEEAELFLNPALDRLHDPFLLPDAEIACERLKTALHEKEKILIHGDYDGDGVTSAALWTRVLRSLGAEVDVFVPHRGRDGYDMRSNFIDRAKENGFSLIVTTDCGIRRIEEVEHARQCGIDVIITDHHTPSATGELPKAVAVVNPHRADSKYPFPDLAGVGVAFKMGEALTRHLGLKTDSYRRAFLDLAAIGTVTDVMKLMGENRILVRHGLEALQNTKKPGLRALIHKAGYAGKPMNTGVIGFGIGPRLNAAGRVDETQHALDLLLTKDENEAERLAERLEQCNILRRERTDQILEEARAQVAQQDVTEARCLVVDGCDWPGGVIGLVAHRIMEQYCRPCIVISVDTASGVGRGSARSVRGFNILEAIDDCRDLLDEYGGHDFAAGLSIEGERVADFRAQMMRIASQKISEEDLVPTLDVAVELAPEEICPELLQQIDALAPFGSGNHEPLFVTRGVRIAGVDTLTQGLHLKFRLRTDGLNPSGFTDGLFWRQGELAEMFNADMSLDLCYQMEFNVFRGERKIQFNIRDFRPPEW